METEIAKVVRAFRAELAIHNSTFFLIYSDLDLESNQVKVKVTTNSTVAGASSILGMFLEPTEQGRAMFHEVLALVNSTQTVPSNEEEREILELLCKMFKLRDIAPPSSVIQA